MEIRKSLRQIGRRHYTDDNIEDEIEGKRSYDVSQKLSDPKFNINSYVKELKGEELTINYLQMNGFTTPLVIKDKTGLGLRVPSQNFWVDDVRRLVGSYRLLDVMDVETQKDLVMTMKDWCRYFKSPLKHKLLNVISLEFSKTKLEDYVDMPRVIKNIDWVNSVWPVHLLEAQNVATNNLSEMKYPKVRKYVLMSVAGCYTDFHLDFGGTSVWYHILHGSKIFWLIPPTEKNYKLYVNWTLSANQGDMFLGDLADGCSKVYLEAGDTFLLPTGWIHAVFTPKDSLVFGGNFLHSFSIQQQLKVNDIEDLTHVKAKFRYPFYNEIHWFVLEKYVRILSGKSFLNILKEYLDADSIFVNQEETNPNRVHIHLTKWEIESLKTLINFLTTRPFDKQNIPNLITDPEKLVKEAEKQLSLHYNDSLTEAVTGQHILTRPDSAFKNFNTYSESGFEDDDALSYKSHIFTNKIKNYYKPGRGRSKIKNFSNPHLIFIPKNELKDAIYANILRKRRIRCMQCEACLREDCKECQMCKGMIKFGGPGTLKKPCVSRQCMMPLLPRTTTCFICLKREPPLNSNIIDKQFNPQNLNECIYCRVISHPECLYNYKKGRIEEDENEISCEKNETLAHIEHVDKVADYGVLTKEEDEKIHETCMNKDEDQFNIQNNLEKFNMETKAKPFNGFNGNQIFYDGSGHSPEINGLNSQVSSVIQYFNDEEEIPLIDTNPLKNINFKEKGFINEDNACWWECPNCLQLLSDFSTNKVVLIINSLTKRLQMLSSVLEILPFKDKSEETKEEILTSNIIFSDTNLDSSGYLKNSFLENEKYHTKITKDEIIKEEHSLEWNKPKKRGRKPKPKIDPAYVNLDDSYFEKDENALQSASYNTIDDFDCKTTINEEEDPFLKKRKTVNEDSHNFDWNASLKKSLLPNDCNDESKSHRKEYECISLQRSNEDSTPQIDLGNDTKVLIRRKINGSNNKIGLSSHKNNIDINNDLSNENAKSLLFDNIEMALHNYTSQILKKMDSIPRNKNILLDQSCQTENIIDERKSHLLENSNKDCIISRPSKRISYSSLIPKLDNFNDRKVRQERNLHLPYTMRKELWILIFSYLSKKDLVKCKECCKVWNYWGESPILWNSITINSDIFKSNENFIVEKLKNKKPTKLVVKNINLSSFTFNNLLLNLTQLNYLKLININFTMDVIPREVIWNLEHLILIDCQSIDDKWLCDFLTNKDFSYIAQDSINSYCEASSSVPCLKSVYIKNCPRISFSLFHIFFKIITPFIQNYYHK